MKSLHDYNLILINLDGFRKDKIDLCKNLQSFKENSYYFSNMITEHHIHLLHFIQFSLEHIRLDMA